MKQVHSEWRGYSAEEQVTGKAEHGGLQIVAYDLTLLPSSTETHDATATDGRLVQIKATQGRMIGLSSEPDYLLVLQLLKDGSTEEIYNGPGGPPWNAAGKMQKNGHRPISVSRLYALAKDVRKEDRLSRRRDQTTCR